MRIILKQNRSTDRVGKRVLTHFKSFRSCINDLSTIKRKSAEKIEVSRDSLVKPDDQLTIDGTLVYLIDNDVLVQSVQPFEDGMLERTYSDLIERSSLTI